MYKRQQLDREIVEEIEEIQRVSFKKHIRLAQKHDLALSIHARDINEEQRCVQDVLEIVAQEGKGLIKDVYKRQPSCFTCFRLHRQK